MYSIPRASSDATRSNHSMLHMRLGGRRALGLSRRICRPLCALSGACDFVQVVGLAWGERVMHIIGSMTFKDEKNDLSLTLEVMSHPARYSMWHSLASVLAVNWARHLWAYPGTPFPLCATKGTR